MSTVVELPFNAISGERTPEFVWALENCPSFTTSNVYFSKMTLVIQYHFDSEEDAVLFTLRWL